MNRPNPAAVRQTWLIIFGALCLSVLVYLLIGYLMEHGSKPRRVNPQALASMTPIMIFLAGAMLVASVIYVRILVDGKIGEDGRPIVLSPVGFQSGSIVSLALSEACTLFGLFLFFLGAPLQQLALFAQGTLSINFAFILPRGLRFWAAYARSTQV